MAKLVQDDKFIVQRNSNYYSVSYGTIVDSVTVGTATQGDAVSGVPGKMFPSSNGAFVYDKTTGMLDINIPTSLNFVGTIETSYAPPERVDTSFSNGDFYLVSPDVVEYPNGVLTLYYNDWTGVSDTEFYSVDVTTRGGEYRGDTGLVTAFGDALETSCINITNPEIGYGLTLSTRMQDGFIVVAETTVRNGGLGYQVDDVIELRSIKPTFLEPQAFIKVKTISAVAGEEGKILSFDFIESETNTDVFTGDVVGGNFFVPTADVSTQKNVRTKTRSLADKGDNLFVNITMQNGQVTEAEISSISGHTGYTDGSLVWIYNAAIGDFGNSVITVNITDEKTETFTVAKGDKIIYSTQEIGGDTTTRWVLIKDSITASTITDIVSPARGVDEVFNNNNLAVQLERSATNTNEFQISIKNALFIEGNPDNSYSGLLTPEDKNKLDSITTIGSVTGISTFARSDNFTGTAYTPVKLVELDGDYRLSINSAEIGRLGLTSITRNTDVVDKVSDYHENREEGVQVVGSSEQSSVMSANQSIETFCPNNFFALPSIS